MKCLKCHAEMLRILYEDAVLTNANDRAHLADNALFDYLDVTLPFCYSRNRAMGSPDTQNEIAVIFDLDDTLAEDTTAAFVESLGLDPQTEFYDVSARRITEGWDPPLAYLTLLCDYVREQRIPPISQQDFIDFGKAHKSFTGVSSMLRQTKKEVENKDTYKEAGLQLSYYIVSGGIGDIARSLPIAPLFQGIWACEFDYEETVPELVEARERDIVVICRSGYRSVLAAYVMQLMGYRSVWSLKTGVKGWNDYDQPLYGPDCEELDGDEAWEIINVKLREEQKSPARRVCKPRVD